MLWDIIVYSLFFFMVVAPVFLERGKIIERGKIVKDNFKYSLYVIPVFIILMITAFFAFILSEYLTVLKWGWLGHNIVGAPIVDASENMSNNSSIQILSILMIVGGLIIMILACLIFNYDEEEMFRDSWRDVVFWAFLHLIMGIPIFAVIPIFSVGVIYKKIKDIKGQNAAFTIHFLVNSTLIMSLMVLTLGRMVV